MILKVGHVGNRPPRRSKQSLLLSLRTHYLTHTFCFHFCAPTSRVSRRLGALCQGTCHHAPTKYTVNRAGRAWRALGKLPTQPEAAEKGRSGVLLLLLLNPRGRRKRTIPLAPPASPRSEMRWLGWRRMADRALSSRVDLESGEHVPSRTSSTSQSLPGTKGQAPENRRGPHGFCCCSCCRCGPTTPLNASSALLRWQSLARW